jgi:hypothetical protein
MQKEFGRRGQVPGCVGRGQLGLCPWKSLLPQVHFTVVLQGVKWALVAFLPEVRRYISLAACWLGALTHSCHAEWVSDSTGGCLLQISSNLRHA